MKVIGLTGNIGCGKSTVAGMLRRHGVATVDADELTRSVRETDPDVRRRIEERFGTLVPGELARIVFDDPDALAALEAILHPVVRERVLEQLTAAEAAGAEVAVVEAIKLLESPLRDRCDAIWVVTCPEAESIDRVVGSRRLTPDDVRARLANQSPQSEKVAAADVVIDGSAPLATTRRQVADALRALVAAAG